jgi:hypothetical protein
MPTGCWLALHAASGSVAGRSTRSLDLTEMSWHIRDLRGLKHRPGKPVKRRHRAYFHASQWRKFHQIILGITIRKLGREEYFSSGPRRALFRGKRMRAVSVFRERFGEAPILRDYSKRHPPWG